LSTGLALERPTMNLNLVSLFPFLIGPIGNLLNFGSTLDFS
jgi:hypothetical protein